MKAVVMIMRMMMMMVRRNLWLSMQNFEEGMLFKGKAYINRKKVSVLT